MKIIYTLFFLILISCILTHSQISLYYALLGLELWYRKMIPALLPFMILSGIMIRMQLTKGFVTIIYPVIHPVFRISHNVCYGMLMGFLCGFPMGAKTVYDLLSRQMITQREAEYLLAFCNNIGPVYFCSFVLPLLHRRLILPYILGMYGLPLLYGLILRYTKFRDLTDREMNAVPSAIRAASISDSDNQVNILEEIDDAINSSVQSILSLGGYMILFNLINLLPHLLLGETAEFLAPLLEISGGLSLLKDRFPLYTLLLLPFGGFSCIAQTYACIKKTPLSITDYTFHKLILTALTIVYYLSWYLLSPFSFLC